MKKVYFVSGIDTDIGKSYATAHIANLWRKEGHNVITQKFIQTGNVGRSEDIELHRQLMDMELTEEDKAGLTMPEIFSYPASPELAARIDGRDINFAKMEAATQLLAEKYDTILLEGAGGLMVPLTTELLTIDYVAEKKYPIIFVTSGRLGSVNHTLLSFEAMERRGMKVDYIAYNLHPAPKDKTIQQDTEQYIRRYAANHFPEAEFIVVPEMK